MIKLIFGFLKYGIIFVVFYLLLNGLPELWILWIFICIIVLFFCREKE